MIRVQTMDGAWSTAREADFELVLSLVALGRPVAVVPESPLRRREFVNGSYVARVVEFDDGAKGDA